MNQPLHAKTSNAQRDHKPTPTLSKMMLGFIGSFYDGISILWSLASQRRQPRLFWEEMSKSGRKVVARGVDR